MKFTCLQTNLARSLASVSRVVSSRPSLPVLANVLIVAEKNKLKLATTDLEIGINTWLGADIAEEGSTTVSAKMFFEFVNSLPEGKLEIELAKGQLIVKAENNEAKFNVLSAEEFPPVPSVEGESILTLKREEFVKAINRVTVATASDDSRPILTGISFEGVDKVLTLVSTDGFRLSKQVIDLKKKLPDDLNLIVPAKAPAEIARGSDESSDEDSSGEVEIYLLKDKNQAIFRAGEVDVVSRLIEGKFPDYKKFIPTGYQTRVEMKIEEFRNAVKIANIFARNDLNNKVILHIDKDKNSISLSASLAEVGQNKTDFPVKVEGDSLDIGFKTKFLMDMLNEVEGDIIYMECNDSAAPGVFKLKSDSAYLHFLMPILIDAR